MTSPSVHPYALWDQAFLHSHIHLEKRHERLYQVCKNASFITFLVIGIIASGVMAVINPNLIIPILYAEYLLYRPYMDITYFAFQKLTDKVHKTRKKYEGILAVFQEKSTPLQAHICYLTNKDKQLNQQIKPRTEENVLDNFRVETKLLRNKLKQAYLHYLSFHQEDQRSLKSIGTFTYQNFLEYVLFKEVNPDISPPFFSSFSRHNIQTMSIEELANGIFNNTSIE